MNTLSKMEFHTMMLETLKRLGGNSNYCYILVNSSSEPFTIEYCNAAYTELTGFSERDIVGNCLKSIFLHISATQYEVLVDTIAKGEISEYEVNHLKKIGDSFQAKIIVCPLQDQYFQTHLTLIAISDITYKNISKYGDELERKMFRAIEKEKTIFEKLMLTCSFMDRSLGPDIFTTIVMRMDENLYITSAQNFGQSYTHMIPKGMANSYYKILMKLDDSKVFWKHKGYPLSFIHQQYAIDNEYESCWQIPIPIHTGEVIGVITIFFKVQEKPREFYNAFITKVINLIGLAYTYEQKQQQIYRLAYTDISTGLPNRHDFIRKVKEDLEGTILFIEPSEFSKFVELYGRDFGDELLKQIAHKIEKISAINLLAQFSSSILAIHIKEEVEKEEIERILFKIVGESISIYGNTLYVSFKIGVETLKGTVSIENAVRNAENALAYARAKNGMQVVYYNNQMQEQLKKELVILNSLVDGIKNKEFLVYVQPKIELYRGRISSMEALARWYSPKLGYVSPGDFIPIAEQAGLIREIDLQIFEQICIWMQQRQYEGEKIIPISVNISPDHFYHPDFMEGLKYLIAKYYMDPKYIIIEVTESIGLIDREKAREILLQLSKVGFRTSIDDFGVGYSSLSYLQRLYFSELKIDQSFITQIHHIGTQALVKGIIQIARSLNIDTIAEGVETQEQLEILKQLGCETIQGYIISKPIPLDLSVNLKDFEDF